MDEMYARGAGQAINRMVEVVRVKRDEAMRRWEGTPEEYTATRAYWRGKVKSFVEVLKELGVDE